MKQKKMTLKKWALNELKRIENTYTDEDSSGEQKMVSLGVQKMVTKNVMDILTVFEKQDHSGISADYTINLVIRLLRWIPLTPLTGEEDEWYEPYGPDNTQQNKRCTTVFRRNFDNSTAYNIHGRVFSNNGKTWWTNRNSLVPVTFPYVVPTEPERVYLKKEEVKNLYAPKALFTLEGELTPENKTTLEQLGFERAHFNSLANVAKGHYLKRFEKAHIYVYDDGCCSVWGKITEEVKFYIEILKGLPQPEIDDD